VALVSLALLVTGCQAFVLDTDVSQARFDSATPALNGSHTLVQSFVCLRPNLCEVELLPAVYETPGAGMLTWQISTADGTNLAAHSVQAVDIQPNVPLRLAFVPQSDSAGQTYTLRLEGGAGVTVGFWRSTFDAYDGGELQLDSDSPAGDLRFSTRCRYDLPALFHQAGASCWPHLGLLIPLAALLLLPGYVFRHNLGLAQHSDPVATLALTIALSLALVPVALLWSTVAGLQWQRTLCQVGIGLLAVYAVTRLWRTHCSDLATWLDRRHRPVILVMFALLAVTLLLRLIQIRNVALPAWVDSPLHALVAQLVSLHGQVPRSYEPLLPVESFAYHFGFHADTAVFAWLTGLTIPRAMLILGQVLNAVCIVSTYLLSLRLTGRRVAGVVAAAVVGLVSYLPAYYVSWGRYTQLTGMLLLPAALVTALEWLEGEGHDYRWLLGAAVMQAGLFVTHARVSIFGACFLLAYLLLTCAGHLCRGNRSECAELWRRSGLLALLAVGLSAPWLAQVVTVLAATLRTAASSLLSDSSYNAIPLELLFIARNRALMAIAALGAIVGLLQRKRETTVVLLWCLLVALVVNPGWFGLPVTGLMNNATAIIALFLPLAVLCGQAITLVWDQAPATLASLAERLGCTWRVTTATRIALAVLLSMVALWNGWGMVSVVNPDTILATAEDLVAMDWIRENTPPDTVFLINTRYWQLGMYAGTDGGYWIPLLTGRRALLPPIAYSYGSPEYVQHVAEMASVVSETRDVQDVQVRAILEREQVAYVYIGVKGGSLTPGMFLGQPGYRPAYTSGGVWIFEVIR